jgi:UDP-N-acetylmuramate dehydrogenase
VDHEIEELHARLRQGLRGPIVAGESLARHTSYRIGGPARLFCVLAGLHDLRAVFEALAEHPRLEWMMLGRGTNVLVADEGFPGVVLQLGPEFKRIRVEDERLLAGGGTLLAAVVKEAWSRGLGGLAWAAGIPGTVGGALAGNAGAYDLSIGDTVKSVTVYHPVDGLRRLSVGEIVFGYRTSSLWDSGVVVECELGLEPDEVERIRAEMERCFRRRKLSQPIGVPSAGSVFKNPPGIAAGRLLEELGLKGARAGRAEISTTHANFIVNRGGASAADVIELIKAARRAARSRGVTLPLEIRLIGDFSGYGLEQDA